MKLTGKLFSSYLVIVAVSLLVLALATAYVAPADFSRRVEHMMGTSGPGETEGQGRRPGIMSNMMEGYMDDVEDADQELNDSFRQSVNNALFWAALAATLTAIFIALFISRKIVFPIKALVKASKHVAAGHYSERLPVQSNDELGELTESFNQMAEALAETEDMRRQLMADVTHELKTPLAGIKGYMEGLEDGVIEATPGTFRIVHREAERMQRLVQDLEVLSRAEAGQMNIKPQRCAIEPLVNAVSERLRPQFVEKNVGLHITLPIDSVFVFADHDRVGQVLTNLLTNALQHTPSSGNVTVSATPQDNMLQFSIHDTGDGLSPEDIKRIFQRFYRVDKSRSRAAGGSGIGLTIARHLVEAQGGRIWAESAGLGQGSTFCFTLPL